MVNYKAPFKKKKKHAGPKKTHLQATCEPWALANRAKLELIYKRFKECQKDGSGSKKSTNMAQYTALRESLELFKKLAGKEL